MSIEHWIDAVVAVAGSVASHRGGTVRAYRIAAKAEIPEALSTFPCAIVYPEKSLRLDYSAGGACIEIWQVKGLFYLFADNKKSNLPDLIRYFSKIRDATLARPTLGGLVDHFTFGEDGMTLVELNYEVEGPPRHGIEVTWQVKQNVTGEVNFGSAE